MSAPEVQGSPEKRAIASLLDVLEELVGGLANGHTPTTDWYELVCDTFKEHRDELGVIAP